MTAQADELYFVGPWPANGESGAPAEPTEMETSSPWELEAAPPPAPREGWASFDSKSEASVEDSWADFSSFSDLRRWVQTRAVQMIVKDCSMGGLGWKWKHSGNDCKRVLLEGGTVHITVSRAVLNLSTNQR